MTNILYLDTETHDYHEESSPADPVQIAVVLSSGETGRTLSTLSTLITRTGWQAHGGNPPPIAERVISKHGITESMCQAWGEAPQLVLEHFRRLLARASLVVAHNVQFDVSVMTHAMVTARCPPLAWPPLYCTMVESAPIIRIPSTGRYNIGGWKAPKLVEAYRYFAGRELANNHDALADVYACRAIHRGILRHQAEAKITLSAAPETG